MQTNNVVAGHKNKQSYANKRKTGKEQYYTRPEVVEICIKEVQKVVNLDGRIILEPAGGTGEFIEGFRKAGIKDENILSYDIEPKHDLVLLSNFLEVKTFPATNMISITNPPFGRMSSLAVDFFNASADNCDYICYIIPKSWRKWTTKNRLDPRFHLVSDIDLPKNCFYLPDEQETKKNVLETVFQIWEKRSEKRQKIKVPNHGLVKKIKPDKNKIIKGANFSMVVFGHSCGKCQDITAPEVSYKTTTMYFHIEKEEVKEALKKINFSQFYNNVAYVQALSIEEINFKLNEFFGLDNLKI
jgi:hypothetical protein